MSSKHIGGPMHNIKELKMVMPIDSHELNDNTIRNKVSHNFFCNYVLNVSNHLAAR